MTESVWVEVAVAVAEAQAPAVVDLLRPYAFQESVVVEQWGDPDDLDPDALLPDVLVKLYWPVADAAPERRAALALHLAAAGFPLPDFRTLAEKEWATAWQAGYRPLRIGSRLVIVPSWLSAEPRPDALPDDIILELDPGMAFGTGLHATTQLCLRLLEQTVRPGARVLDLGTGTGILAMAALRLGAASVLAVDNDPTAVQVARENGRRNGLALDVQVGELGDVAQRDWDLLLVNILAPVIIQLLETGDLLAYGGAGARLIFSGIILTQLEEVTAAVEAAGGRVVDVLTEGEWVGMLVAPGD